MRLSEWQIRSAAGLAVLSIDFWFGFVRPIDMLRTGVQAYKFCGCQGRFRELWSSGGNSRSCGCWNYGGLRPLRNGTGTGPSAQFGVPNVTADRRHRLGVMGAICLISSGRLLSQLPFANLVIVSLLFAIVFLLFLFQKLGMTRLRLCCQSIFRSGRKIGSSCIAKIPRTYQRTTLPSHRHWKTLIFFGSDLKISVVSVYFQKFIQTPFSKPPRFLTFTISGPCETGYCRDKFRAHYGCFFDFLLRNEVPTIICL